MQKSFEDLAVLFAVLIICRVERSWSLVAWYVVVGPLPRGQIAERVPKEIFFAVDGVGVFNDGERRKGRTLAMQILRLH